MSWIEGSWCGAVDAGSRGSGTRLSNGVCGGATTTTDRSGVFEGERTEAED